MQTLTKKSAALRKHYDSIGFPFTNSNLMLGFMGDIGQLAKLVQMKEGSRSNKYGEKLEGLLGHEIADCLWCVLLLADAYNVDVADELSNMVDEKIAMGKAA